MKVKKEVLMKMLNVCIGLVMTSRRSYQLSFAQVFNKFYSFYEESEHARSA